MENWQTDYEVLTNDCGTISLRDWSQVRLTGSDRVKFLHNMCTNDIRRLEIGQMCEAFCTDVKGKIIAHVLVIVAADHVMLLAVPGQTESLISHLDRYIIREDVQLADVSNEIGWDYVVGPRATQAIEQSNPFIVKCDLLWPGGFLIRDQTHEESTLTLPTISPESPAFSAVRLESGWPLFGQDFDESNLPQEIDRNELAINFNKGCYLGQETIARIDALGHVNKKLVLLKFTGKQVPEVGAKLLSASQEVGMITSSTWSPRFSAPLAFAFVRRGTNELGTNLQCGSDQAEIVAPIRMQGS